MNEYITTGSNEVVSDVQVSDEGSQAEVETTETVNADSAEVTSGEVGETSEGSNQTETDAQEQTEESEPHTQSKEENSQFARVRREAEARMKAEFEQQQAAKDAEFAKRAAEFGWVDAYGNPIKTESEYWKAVDAQRAVDSLVNQGKDPETAKLQVEFDRLKAERENERKAAQEQAKRQEENNEFFEFYKEVNGKEFNATDEIPQEVFDISQAKGIPLKYAYAEHIAKAAREKEKNLALGKQTAEVNVKNSTNTTGSVTGSPQSDALTEAEIDAHADDVVWMNKNFKRVENFYRKKG